MIAEAAHRHSDLMVFPELFATKHTGAPAREMAEPIPEGEISQTLGVPVGTSKARLHRAREMLRERLGEAMREYA